MLKLFKSSSTREIPIIDLFLTHLGSAYFDNKLFRIASSPKLFNPGRVPKWILWIEGEGVTFSIKDNYSFENGRDFLSIYKDNTIIGKVNTIFKNLHHRSFEISCNDTSINYIYVEEAGYKIIDKEKGINTSINRKPTFLSKRWEDFQIEIYEKCFEPLMIGISLIYRLELYNQIRWN